MHQSHKDKKLHSRKGSLRSASEFELLRPFSNMEKDSALTMNGSLDPRTFSAFEDDEHTSIPTLKPANAITRPKLPTSSGFRYIVNSFSVIGFEYWGWAGSVWPAVYQPTLFMTIWAAIWTFLYETSTMTFFAIGNQLVVVLSLVIGLLLVFRNNTAYDRCNFTLNLHRLRGKTTLGDACNPYAQPRPLYLHLRQN